jgi:hypothetical protein
MAYLLHACCKLHLNRSPVLRRVRSRRMDPLDPGSGYQAPAWSSRHHTTAPHHLNMCIHLVTCCGVPHLGRLQLLTQLSPHNPTAKQAYQHVAQAVMYYTYRYHPAPFSQAGMPVLPASSSYRQPSVTRHSQILVDPAPAAAVHAER